MRNDTVGIIFSNINDTLLPQMTQDRCLGSVPFGGRYRLIDFALSNLVASGISSVAIVTRSNYRSLMDHIQSGKQWDLARKEGGVFFISPYVYQNGFYHGRLEALLSVEQYLKSNNEKYVVFSDCNYICNIDIEDLVDRHEKTGADITFLYSSGLCPDSSSGVLSFTEIEKDGRVKCAKTFPKDTETDFSVNIFVAEREFMLSLIEKAKASSYYSFEKDVIINNIDNYKIYAQKTDGVVLCIDSIQKYFDASLQLFKPSVHDNILNHHHDVLTKVRDEMPARYGMDAKTKNSLIADGCVIEGNVDNSILFREVKIGAGASLSNCIVMQGSEIGENVSLSYCIVDKDCVINTSPSLNGSPYYPLYIKKGTKI